MAAQAELMRCLSFRALDRAQHTIKDFVQTYFPLYGLDPLKDFLRWWHILVFVEGAIYQADEDNEAAAGAADEPATAAAALQAVEAVLRGRGLLSAGVAGELAAGRAFWGEERRLCGLMAAAPVVPPGGHGERPGFALADVLAASGAKSFDYRLLHHLLCALREGGAAPPEPALLAFLEADELLVDIGDDLLDYEDDITAGGTGSFNVLRCYVHLFGSDAPVRLAQRIGELERQREALLAALPPAQQAHVRARTVDAAEEGEGALRWQFPPLVLDEAAFRAEHGDSGGE